MYIRHSPQFLHFDRPMPRRIGRLKNYKIMSSERTGLNKELGVLAFTLSSLFSPAQVVCKMTGFISQLVRLRSRPLCHLVAQKKSCTYFWTEGVYMSPWQLRMSFTAACGRGPREDMRLLQEICKWLLCRPQFHV